MTIRREIADKVQEFRMLSFYERVEQIIALVLSTLIVLVIAAAIWSLIIRVAVLLYLSTTSLAPATHAVFQTVFGGMFTVIIAVEFKRSILVAAERRDTIFQVRTVVLIALLAILRKFIILDFQQTDAGIILALSAATLALGGVYWALRAQDVALRAEELPRVQPETPSEREQPGS